MDDGAATRNCGTAAVKQGEDPVLSDEEVVARVLAGETALYEVLMRRHNQRLYRVARSILGNDQEAEDVMQDAYVRAYTHLDQFAGRAKFSTWLTKIAVHEASARARRAGRFESLDPAGDESEGGRGLARTMGDMNNPERQVFGGEVRRLLEEALDALPRDYRTVFVLREIEEMDTEDTAGVLGVSDDVVKTRLHRARALLKKDLYRRAGSTGPSAFVLHLARCDRVVHAVLSRITQPGRVAGSRLKTGVGSPRGRRRSA